MNEHPYFLEQQEPRLSEKEATQIVDDLLILFKVRPTSKSAYIYLNHGQPNEQKKKYFQLIGEVRKTGVCNFLQTYLDRTDPIFGGTFSISMPNQGIPITTSWAGYKKTLTTPCRNAPAEWEFASDIEFYKEETCTESDKMDFEMTIRNFRGFLFSSLALIDSYVNRHIIYYKHVKLEGDEFIKLTESRNTEERIELFVKLFCDFNISELKKGKEWKDFKELKNLRNEIIHSINPYLGIEIKDIAKNLNLSIRGVGGLLKKLQSGQGRPSLGFIEMVRTSPLVHYNEITYKAKDRFQTKKKFNHQTR